MFYGFLKEEKSLVFVLSFWNDYCFFQVDFFFRDSDDVGMTYLQIGYQIGDQAHTVRIYNAEVDRVHFT